MFFFLLAADEFNGIMFFSWPVVLYRSEMFYWNKLARRESHLRELYRFVAALFVLVHIGFRNSWVRCDIGVVFKQPKNCIYSCGIFYLILVFRWSAVFISPWLICFHFWCEKGLGQHLLPIFYLFLMMWKCCCIGTFIYKMLSSNTRLIELWNRNPRGKLRISGILTAPLSLKSTLTIIAIYFM